MSLFKITAGVCLLFISAAAYTQATAVADSAKADETIFKKVETEADFPGGIAAWKKYLEKNLKADVPGENGAPDGKYTIMVEFVVDKNGWVSDIKPLTNYGYGMEEEVIRIIKKSGAWSPAVQDGKNLKAYRKQPVTFVVMSDDVTIDSKELYTFFTGVENEFTVSVTKVKPKDLQLTISQGSITSLGDGKFKAKVNKPGRALVTITNSRNNKKIADVNFEVK